MRNAWIEIEVRIPIQFEWIILETFFFFATIWNFIFGIDFLDLLIKQNWVQKRAAKIFV